MSNLYRGPSINTSYQGSVHLTSGFRGENLKKLANKKQELAAPMEDSVLSFLKAE
jgi:hypothetical protein